jgi:hypothetical protein
MNKPKKSTSDQTVETVETEIVEEIQARMEKSFKEFCCSNEVFAHLGEKQLEAMQVIFFSGFQSGVFEMSILAMQNMTGGVPEHLKQDIEDNSIIKKEFPDHFAA